METTNTSPISSSESITSGVTSPTTSDSSSNGYIKRIPYSHSAILSHQTPKDTTSGSSTPNSMKNNCSRSSIDSSLTFLKKSFSVNSALSKHTHKTDWNSFSSLSLAYLTSTFLLFSPADKQ